MSLKKIGPVVISSLYIYIYIYSFGDNNNKKQ